MLFALTDLVTVIEVHHIHAALAWTRFHRDSVRFIFNDAAGEDAARESTEAAKKIVDYLRQHGRTGRRDLQQKCFSGHLSATRLDEALDSLLMDSPPRVELIEGSRTDNGKLPKFYQLLTLCELGEPANLPTNKGFPQVRPVAKLDNLNSCQVNPGSPGYPGSQVGESAEALINRASSPSYPSSHKANGKQIIELEL